MHGHGQKPALPAAEPLLLLGSAVQCNSVPGSGVGLVRHGRSGHRHDRSGHRRVGPGIAKIGPGIATIGPGIATIGPGIATIGPGIATIGPGIVTAGPGDAPTPDFDPLLAACERPQHDVGE